MLSPQAPAFSTRYFVKSPKGEWKLASCGNVPLHSTFEVPSPTLLFSPPPDLSECFLVTILCEKPERSVHTTLQHTATRCNTLQHAATHYNTLQHTATHCNTLQHTATHTLEQQPRFLPRRVTGRCTLQHAATHCNVGHITSIPPFTPSLPLPLAPSLSSEACSLSGGACVTSLPLPSTPPSPTSPTHPPVLDSRGEFVMERGE